MKHQECPKEIRNKYYINDKNLALQIAITLMGNHFWNRKELIKLFCLKSAEINQKYIIF